MRAAAWLVPLALAAGCAAHFPRPRVPMAALRRPQPGVEHAETAVIFLPGRKDRARVFADKGMLDIVRRDGLHAELIAADAHAGYYVRGTLVRRLDQDVVEPARARGERRIVLVGVSMGGYGAVRYAMAHPGRVDELVLLSPFLGAGHVMEELADAGDPDFALTWQWLRKYPRDPKERAAAGYPRLVLGYGEEDLFLHTDKELAKLLVPEDVVTTFGAHEWATWRALLEQMLAKRLLQPPVLPPLAP